MHAPYFAVCHLRSFYEKLLLLVTGILVILRVSHKGIRLGLTGFGIFFTTLGVFMLFNKGLLAMGNIGVLILSYSQSFSLLSLSLILTHDYVALYALSPQILFLSGVAVTMGPTFALQLFVKPQNYKVYFIITFSLSLFPSCIFRCLLFTSLFLNVA